jgi:hypothetical protein
MTKSEVQIKTSLKQVLYSSNRVGDLTLVRMLFALLHQLTQFEGQASLPNPKKKKLINAHFLAPQCHELACRSIPFNLIPSTNTLLVQYPIKKQFFQL